MMNRRYGTVLALLAFLGGALLASPGCGGEGGTCPDIASKICDKACSSCGEKCAFSVAGSAVNTGTKILCVPAYTSQCANQTGIDYMACSAALDTAQCDESGAVKIPTECTSAPSDAGGG